MVNKKLVIMGHHKMCLACFRASVPTQETKLEENLIDDRNKKKGNLCVQPVRSGFSSTKIRRERLHTMFCSVQLPEPGKMTKAKFSKVFVWPE